MNYIQDTTTYYVDFFSDLSHKDVPHKLDFLLMIPFFFGITVFRIVAEMMLENVGRVLVSWNKPSFQKEKPKDHARKMVQFREQTFKFLYHGFCAFITIYLFSQEIWWKNPLATMNTLTTDILFSNTHKLYYMFQTGFHLHSLIYHYIERRSHVRDDDFQMQVHHFATMWLLIGSFHASHLRIGTLVLFVHDASDVPTALAKMANYTKFSDVVLAVLLTNLIFWWSYLRLYRFPVDVILVIMRQYGYPNDDLFVDTLTLGLLILQVLHWIWFVQILNIPLAIALGQEEYDTTEHWKKATQHKNKNLLTQKPAQKKQE